MTWWLHAHFLPPSPRQGTLTPLASPPALFCLCLCASVLSVESLLSPAPCQPPGVSSSVNSETLSVAALSQPHVPPILYHITVLLSSHTHHDLASRCFLLASSWLLSHFECRLLENKDLVCAAQCVAQGHGWWSVTIPGIKE